MKNKLKENWKKNHIKYGDAIIAIDERGYSFIVYVLTDNRHTLNLIEEETTTRTLFDHFTALPGLYYATCYIHYGNYPYNDEIRWKLGECIYNIKEALG